MLHNSPRLDVRVFGLIGLVACAIAPRSGNGDEAALKPLDPVEQARRALEGFMTKAPLRVPGEEGWYRPVFSSRLLPVPARGHDRWDLGDCTSRAVLAWTALREMTDDQTTGLEVDRGQREFLLSMVHPEMGLVWYAADPKTKTYQYNIWDQSRALRALVCWFQSKPADRERLRPLIERMINGLDALATIRGTDPVWGPYAGLPSDEYTNNKPGPACAGYFVNNRAGLCIEPLVDYARLTDDPKILDLAVRFANCELGGHQGDKVAPAEKPYFQFGADGSFVGHFHTKSSMLIGIAKLGRHLAVQGRKPEATRYLRAARKSYDWIFAADNPKRGSRTGWIPETAGRPLHETCCAADMIELAAALASCSSVAQEFRDWADLYDDVEAMTVNVVSRSQLRITPELEKTLAEFYGEKTTEYMEIARRFDGVWLAALQSPDDKLVHAEDGSTSIPLGGCCQYSGVSGFYAGWRDAMIHDHGELRINYFLPRESPWAAMTTAMPVEGRADIALREPADVRIRVPMWLKAEQLAIQVDGKDIEIEKRVEPGRHWVALGRLAAGAKIALRFPLEERQTKERIANQPFTIGWRGNYVVQLHQCAAKLPMFP